MARKHRPVDPSNRFEVSDMDLGFFRPDKGEHFTIAGLCQRANEHRDVRLREANRRRE